MTRTIVVIGGSSGIGHAIATGFARQGNDQHGNGNDKPHVIATGIEPAAPTAFSGDILEFQTLDVTNTEAVQAFFSTLDRLDVLVNCAGIIRRNGAEFTASGFEQVIDVNLTGTLRCCEAAKPLLTQSRGCIINTASMLTFFGSAFSPAYSASKGGIGQLTKSLASAWAPDGIRVNALAPGWIKTDLTAALEKNSERNAQIIARTPMQRWGTPDDLVGPALFLASDQAGFVTGSILPVDGGFSAN